VARSIELDCHGAYELLLDEETRAERLAEASSVDAIFVKSGSLEYEQPALDWDVLADVVCDLVGLVDRTGDLELGDYAVDAPREAAEAHMGSLFSDALLLTTQLEAHDENVGQRSGYTSPADRGGPALGASGRRARGAAVMEGGQALTGKRFISAYSSPRVAAGQ
jgi:hypothetical protein